MFKFSIKQWLAVLIIVLASMVGMYYYLKAKIFTPIVTESTTVMLERMRTVTKLTTVEGQFSEIYQGGEEYPIDFLGLFSKKILVRVTATVACGYDFEKMNIKIDSTNHVVTISDFPKPQVLSVDHDLDYYDVKEGTFNSFTPEEYNKINKGAKDKIEFNPAIPKLLLQSEKQKDDYLRMMDIALKSVGWKLVLTSPNTIKM
jgi:hypothetical protein